MPIYNMQKNSGERRSGVQVSVDIYYYGVPRGESCTNTQACNTTHETDNTQVYSIENGCLVIGLSP